MTMLPFNRSTPANTPTRLGNDARLNASRRGMVLTVLLVTLILFSVIALVSASIFGAMQQRKKENRVGGRYSPEVQEYMDEQNSLLHQTPHWKVKSSDRSKTLVIPIEMAMQSVVREFGKGPSGKQQEPNPSSLPSEDGGS